MINFHDEIENYKKINKLTENTSKIYVKRLYTFCEYLAAELKCLPHEVYLDRIYKVITNSNKIIAYKPLNSKVIDIYLSTLIDSGFSHLATVTHALKSFFRFITNNRNFPNVVSHMEFRLSDHKPESAFVRILSRHEFLRFLHCLVTYSDDLIRDTFLFTLLYSTGCRISEVLNLRVSDVNLNDEMIFLQKTKTKVQRMVVLREGFGEALREYIQINNIKENNYLFVDHREGNIPIKRTDVDKHFKFYLKKARLPPMRIHSSRHSFATHLRDAGIDLFTIMELLGHENFQSTLTYTQPYYTRNAKIKIKEHEDVYSKIRSFLNK